MPVTPEASGWRPCAASISSILTRTLLGEREPSKRGKPMDKGIVHKILNKPLRLGDAIVRHDIWDSVRPILKANASTRRNRSRDG